MQSFRTPACAGSFYPHHPDALASLIDGLIVGAGRAATARAPKVLIAPHAGYIYSGPIAASGYALLARAGRRISRVVLLGPSHRAPVRGLALPSKGAFLTPLGPVRIDADAVRAARTLPQVRIDDAAHEFEHSLEVHLPFLQTLLGEFTLAPFAVGDATASEVAEVLDLLWGDDQTLIVVSSDLSHYLPYEQARAVDTATAETIVSLRGALDYRQACGAGPINGLLATARQRGLRPELLDLRNSGDTAGDRSRVVGYAAFAFHEPPAS